MANTTYETSTWETYGKWTLVALILLLFLVALIAAVWSWEQGYFDTVVPTRPKSARASTVNPAPSVNFSSYRSTVNAQMRVTGTPPAYSPHHLAHGPTPEPTYRTHVSATEQAAQRVCPLPTTASPNPYASLEAEDIELEDLREPDPVATNPWETVTVRSTNRPSLEPIVNKVPSHQLTKKSELSTFDTQGDSRTPKIKSGNGADNGVKAAHSTPTSAPDTPKTSAYTPSRPSGPSSLRSTAARTSHKKENTNRRGATPIAASTGPCTSSSRKSGRGSGTTQSSANSGPGTNSSARSKKGRTIGTEVSTQTQSTHPKDIV